MEDHFYLALRVVIGITCVISMFGSCVIIFTYVAFKELRTLARQQLVNLSVADIIVALSHLVGLVALRVETYNDGSEGYNGSNFSSPFIIENSTVSTHDHHQWALCKVQGGFTMCGTIASFLWSLALGFFMLVIIVFRRPDFGRYLVFLYYPICWGVPLSLTLWFALTTPTYLGFAESADIGWCYIRITPNSSESVRLMSHLVGYGLWVYITVIALAIIYLTMLFYLKCRGTLYRSQARRATDLKLVLVPLIFLLLRIWSAIIDVRTFYYNRTEHPFGIAGYVLVFIAGIGDSAQGLANAILFCVFTKQVRQKLQSSLYSCLCCCCPRNVRQSWPTLHFSSSHSTHVTSHETTTQLDSDSVRSWNALYRADPMVTTDELSNSDRTPLLKGSINEQLSDDRYGSNGTTCKTTDRA